MHTQKAFGLLQALNKFMSMVFSSSLLAKIIDNPAAAAEWYEACSKILPKYEITTAGRISAFLSQCAHESGGFKFLVENLNYSAQGLANTWPSRYAVRDPAGQIKKPFLPNALASQLQRNPELIGNHTYASRMGNSDVASGDGFRYRGRGLIQLTGKANYQAFSNFIGLELDITVAYCETKAGAIESACWFWTKNNLNLLADQLPTGTISQTNFIPITKAINGGTIGLVDRTDKYNKIVLSFKS